MNTRISLYRIIRNVSNIGIVLNVDNGGIFRIKITLCNSE